MTRVEDLTDHKSASSPHFEEIGGNKSVATDKAVNMYIDKMEKKLKK